RICNLAQFVVRKIVLLASLKSDNSALPKLIEKRNEAVLIRVTGLREQFDRERRAHASRQGSQVLRLGRQLRQTCAQDRVNFWRKRRKQPRPDALDDKQRVAFGFAVELQHEFRVELLIGNLTGESRGFVRTKQCQRDLC